MVLRVQLDRYHLKVIPHDPPFTPLHLMTAGQHSSAIKECLRCGSCCRQGGPTLHLEDLPLVRGGHLLPDHLVTIRSGETSYDPLTETFRPVEQELVKISGKNSTWTCRFFCDDKKGSCSIYQFRPLECRLLKCWDTREVKEIIGRNTLDRVSLLSPSDPCLNLMAAQEEKCSYHRVNLLIRELKENPEAEDLLDELTGIVRIDLQIRARAGKDCSVSLARELFLFGRPVFKAIAAYGFRLYEAGPEVFLQPPVQP